LRGERGNGEKGHLAPTKKKKRMITSLGEFPFTKGSKRDHSAGFIPEEKGLGQKEKHALGP